METSPTVQRPPRSITGWLIALVVVAVFAGAGVFVATVPVVLCTQPIHEESDSVNPRELRCYRCSDRGRITFLNRWRDGTQPLPEWEGKEVSGIGAIGFENTDLQAEIEAAGILVGEPVTKRARDRALQKLLETQKYTSVEVLVVTDRTMPGKVTVQVVVDER